MRQGQQQIAYTDRPRMALATEWWRRFGILCLLLATTAIALPAQTFKSLHSFDSTDGNNPLAALVQATNGSLYGTTFSGGVNGQGAVFKVTPSGVLARLYSFCSQSSCTDGSSPYAGLIQAADGNFYGTTYFGGADSGGTVFKITPSGTLTTLYSFCAQSGCTDGLAPQAALVQATDGSLYGTTTSGGANSGGTVFKITPTGTLTTLHSFAGYPGDGTGPFAGLVQAADGNFYGTTYYGGANNNSLCASIGCGTVFKITSKGTLTTLYSFCAQSGCTDGLSPQAGLVQATDGNFYGTTDQGGTNGYGTVFKITPSGTLTTLYSFCSQSRCTDGSYPYAALLQDTNGSLYSTTADGGAYRSGIVFSLSVGLGPFVETLPNLGKVGMGVKILGTNLTGATSVTFNGIPATFTVRSGTFITTTVPAGATSGTVQVVTPSGTLSSNVPFRVRQ